MFLFVALFLVPSILALSPNEFVEIERFQKHVPSPEQDRHLISTLRFNKTLNVMVKHWSCIDDVGGIHDWPWHVQTLVWIDLSNVLLHHDNNLWTAEVVGCSLKQPKFLHSFPIHIDNLKLRVDKLYFTAKVYQNNGTLEHARIKSLPSPQSGILYKDEFVRHWDEYLVPGRLSQLFMMDVHSYQTTNLLLKSKLEVPVPPFGGLDDYDVAPNGQWIAFTSRHPKRQAFTTNQNIYLVKCTGMECTIPESITDDNQGYDTMPKWHPTKPWLAWLRMTRPGYESDKNILMIYDLSTGKYLQLLKHWDKSPTTFYWSPQGEIFLQVSDMGREKIYKLNLIKDQVKVVYKDGSTTHLCWTRQGEWRISSSHKHPPRLYFNDTVFYSPSSLHFPQAKDFTFKARDGRLVHGFYLLPKNHGKKMNVVLLIHGGPHGAWQDEWGWRWNPQLYASQGYLVVMINPRGSVGYGQDFSDEIKKHWGKQPYQDLMDGMKWIESKFPIGKKCALGASFGGYMVNWINTQTRYFDCLVNHDGMFSALASYYATDETFFNEWEWGIPGKGKAWQYDPSLYVKDMKTPTMFIHGERDYRLPVTEGLSGFSALKRNGIDTRLLYFPDENHWVSKPSNLIQWYHEIFSWLSKHLDGKESVHEEVDNNIVEASHEPPSLSNLFVHQQ